MAFSKWQPINIEKNDFDSEKNKFNEIINSHVLRDRRYTHFLLSILPIPLVFFRHFGAYPLFLVHNLKLSTSTYGLVFVINTVMIILIEVPLNNLMMIGMRKNL